MIMICVSAVGCSESRALPKAASLTGEAGGCGTFLVYRFNESRTLAVVVTVDQYQFELSEEPTIIPLEPGQPGVDVQVLHFEQPAGQYFCDDVGGDPEPFATWTVTGGTLEVILTAGTPPANLSNATHKATVILKNATITNSKSSEVSEFGDVRIDDVWVGWFAG